MFGDKSSNRESPRKGTKLHSMILEMVRTGGYWKYQDMAKFGYELSHNRPFDKVDNRGYWSVNIRYAKMSGYIKKELSGRYNPTEKCLRAMFKETLV